ncbi:hypothetical protein FOZ62_018786, partial [Perkinsus olseni]
KCSSLADYPILKQLIVDMYGSETRFEAAVRALWLGERRERQCPAWLFSAASLRIICASYIPLIFGRVAGAIARLIKNDKYDLVPIYSSGVVCKAIPNNVQVLLWELRGSIIPIIFACARAPLMLLIAHELATGWTLSKWCRGVIFVSLFQA